MSENRTPIEHPESGVLAAYLDGSLSADERTPIVAHLDVCPDCRDALSIASATLSEPSPRPAMRWLGPLVAAAAAIMLISGPVARMSAPGEPSGIERSLGSESTLRFDIVAPRDDGAVRDVPRFAWESAGPTASYEIMVTNAVGDIVWSARTTETRIAPPADLVLPPGRYHWVVDALLELGRDATSGPHDFVVEH
jgi:hypothetical protein